MQTRRQIVRSCILLVVAATSLVALPIRALALDCQFITLSKLTSSGQLDSTFGTGGHSFVPESLVPFWRIHDAALSGLHSHAVIVGEYQPGGFGQKGFIVTRVELGGGSLDTSFGGGDGYVTTSFPGSSWHSAKAVVSNFTGEILVAGEVLVDGFIHIGLAKYTSTGLLDTDFGDGGLVVFDTGFDDTEVTDLIQTASGIVVVGSVQDDASPDGMAAMVARFLNDGSPDLDFGVSGLAFTSLTQNDDALNTVAVDGEGRVVTAGWADDEMAVVRYTTDGVLDVDFDGNGFVTIDIPLSSGDVFFDVVIDPINGRITAGGQALSGFGLARLEPSGQIDPTFAFGGLMYTPTPGASAIHSLTWSGNELVAIGSSTLWSSPSPTSVVKYDSSGWPVASFGTNGMVSFSHPVPTHDISVAGLVTMQGSIFAVGWGYNICPT